MAAITPRLQIPFQRMFLHTEMRVRFDCLEIDRVWPSFAIMLQSKSQVDLSSILGHRVLVAGLPH